MAIKYFMLLLCLSAVQGKFFFGRDSKWGLRGPPPAGSVNDYPDSWFNQTLDHFTPSDTRKWQQRYYVNTEFYKPGGPVFIMLGGEGPIMDILMTEGTWITPAKQYGAMLFQLEHRFYGKSHPTSDMSTENLFYLNSEQALLDAATFQQQMTDAYSLGNAKWIVFGCSYSGNLAAWYREQFPNMASGSMAGSAPVRAEVDFYQYYEVISSSLESVYPGCGTQVAEAFKQLEAQMQSTTGQQNINQLFNPCMPVGDMPTNDVFMFHMQLAGSFAGYIQYYDQNLDSTKCDTMVNGLGDALTRLAQVIASDQQPGTCLSASFSDYVAYLQQTEWNEDMDRQWTFQTCNEFGYFQTTNSPNQSFAGIPTELYTDICYTVFGEEYSSEKVYANVRKTNSIYGGKSLSVTNVVFPNGILDPWRSLGIQTDLNKDSPAITIQDSAHCAIDFDWLAPQNPSLAAAQKQVIQLIGKWVTQ